MAGKLTEEQRQEIVRRYQAGESSRQIAASLGCSKNVVCYWARRADLELRAHPWSKGAAISEEEQRQIVDCYLAGNGLDIIVRRFGRGTETILKVLKAMAVEVRNLSQSQRAKNAMEIDQISAARWYELYAAPGSGYPSINELARRFGVEDGSIRLRLKENGIRPRSMGEQIRIELRTGRHPGIPKRGPDGRYPDHIREANERVKGKKLSAVEARRRTSNQKRPSGKLVVRCAWCGDSLLRFPCRIRPEKHYACGADHNAQWRSWRSRGGDKPRPLIADRLRELLRQEPYKALPPTYETLEKAGAAIGAGEAEIIEVLMALRNG